MENITKKIFQTSHKVKEMLVSHPYMRDYEEKLIGNYWNAELKAMGYSLEEISGKDLLELFINKRLTKPDTITRANRKIQETYPHLRGKDWDKRHGIADNVKKEINDFNK